MSSVCLFGSNWNAVCVFSIVCKGTLLFLGWIQCLLRSLGHCSETVCSIPSNFFNRNRMWCESTVRCRMCVGGGENVDLWRGGRGKVCQLRNGELQGYFLGIETFFLRIFGGMNIFFVDSFLIIYRNFLWWFFPCINGFSKTQCISAYWVGSISGRAIQWHVFECLWYFDDLHFLMTCTHTGDEISNSAESSLVRILLLGKVGEWPHSITSVSASPTPDPPVRHTHIRHISLHVGNSFYPTRSREI